MKSAAYVQCNGIDLSILRKPIYRFVFKEGEVFALFFGVFKTGGTDPCS